VTRCDAATARPFIYIASLRRTGSRLIAHELSRWPQTIVLLEPGVARGRFSPRPEEVERCASVGIDLNAHREAAGRLRTEDRLKLFLDDLLPRLRLHVRQAGIKEIHHERWEALVNAIPDMAVIITARDPRDIYLSLLHKSRRKAKPVRLHGPMSPKVVAEDLLRDWTFLRGIIERCRWRPVRYEDYCTIPAERAEIREFVASPLGNSVEGELENLSEHDRARHGTAVTARSVSRWRDEPDAALRAEAHEMLEHMAEYCEFWGYEPQGPRPDFPALRRAGATP